MRDSITHLSITEARVLVQSGQVSPLELTQACLARISRLNPQIHAFLEVAEEQALQTAQEATEEVAHHTATGLLHGIPLALKDLFDVRGMHTTAGSEFLKENRLAPPGMDVSRGVSSRDAAVTEKLRREGAILLGKLNMHEWALGVTTINPFFGACVNPWSFEDPQSLPRISGGSSGGSTAALAAGLCYGSIGSDTGGSIRIPASLCGVVGMKPTYGRVSMRGVIPLSWSLDHVGPMARTVQDVSLLLRCIAGYDEMDPASGDYPAEGLEELAEGSKPSMPWKIGVPSSLIFHDLEEEVEQAFRKATATLEEMGCRLLETELGDVEDASKASIKILLAEAAAFHRERLRAEPQRFGPDVLERLRQGLEISGIDYALARRKQAEWKRKIELLFDTIDLLVLPATPIVAPTISECDGLALASGALTRFMRLFNLTGAPALVLPCGFTTNKLPIGMQIVGPSWQEARILMLARAYESATDWHKRRPHLD